MIERYDTGAAIERARPYALACLWVGYAAAAIRNTTATFSTPPGRAPAILQTASFDLLTGEGWATVAVASTIAAETAVAVLMLHEDSSTCLDDRTSLPLRPPEPGVRRDRLHGYAIRLFILLVDAEISMALNGRLRSFAQRSKIGSDAMSHPVVASVGFLLMAAVVGHVIPQLSLGTLWVVAEGYLALVAVLGFTEGLARVRSRSYQLAPLPAKSQVALAPAYGRCPPPPRAVGDQSYIGLRTTGVLSMFSNLRTEGPGDNHLVLPTFDLFTLQQTAVIVESSSDPIVDELATFGGAIPVSALRRLAEEDNSFEVVGTIDGERVEVSAADGDLPGLSWLERKTQAFRAFAAGDQRFCPNG